MNILMKEKVRRILFLTLWYFNILVAIENGPVEMVSFTIHSMVIFHSDVNVYQRVWDTLYLSRTTSLES